jgi:hypothetical protein
MALNLRGLQTFRAGLPKAVDDGVDETADEVVEEARAIVHEDTGALRTSIEKFGASGTGERTAEAGQGLDYAIHEEYSNNHPYMTPAAEHHRASLPANVAKNLKALERRSGI